MVGIILFGTFGLAVLIPFAANFLHKFFSSRRVIGNQVPFGADSTFPISVYEPTDFNFLSASRKTFVNCGDQAIYSQK
jgi:hypothetical protein